MSKNMCCGHVVIQALPMRGALHRKLWRKTKRVVLIGLRFGSTIHGKNSQRADQAKRSYLDGIFFHSVDLLYA